MTKGKITASCGHEIANLDEAVDVRYGTEECDFEGFHKAVVYAVFCPACAEQAKSWPEYIATDEDENRWFND